jgi:MFS family permease
VRGCILRGVRLVPARLTEAIVPVRLGRSFRWLLGGMLINNFGDGVVLAAGPLLVASMTRDPFLVSMAATFQYLPMLLFGVIGGAFADRFHRTRMVVAANVARAAVMLAVVATILGGTVSIVIVLAALFVLGTAEIFADSASSTLTPSIVAKEDLGVAAARSQGGQLLLNQLVGPPIGAALFAIGMALPFATHAICMALGVVLISRVVATMPIRSGERMSIRADMADGIRWLVGHPPMRTLAVTILMFNITFGAAWSVVVLYSQQRLGMGPVGFGLLSTSIALGGIVGTIAYGALERRFALGDIMRVGLLIETFTHLVLALTTSPAIALATLFVFGIHGFVWGTTSTVVRQRAVPNEMMGRVGGVYRVAIVGGTVIGAPIGGVLATAWGITAPFWFGFFGSAILVVVLWRQFDHIAHAGDEPALQPA